MIRTPSTNAILVLRRTPHGVALAESAFPSTGWTIFGIFVTGLMTILAYRFLPIFKSGGVIPLIWINNTWWVILILGGIMILMPYLRLFRKPRTFALSDQEVVSLPLDSFRLPRSDVVGAFMLSRFERVSDETFVRNTFVLVESRSEDPLPRLYTFLQPHTTFPHRVLARWCREAGIAYLGECTVEVKGFSSAEANRHAQQWVLDQLVPLPGADPN